MSSSESGRVGAITLDQLIALNDEMAALARAGVPLDRGLLAVGRELRGRTGRFATRLGERLERGETLDDAIGADDPAVPDFYRAVVRAGLRSGRLTKALEGLAVYARNFAETRRAIGLALLYPILVAMIAYGLFVGFVILIVPRLTSAFETIRFAPPRSLVLFEWLGGTATAWVPIAPILAAVLGLWWMRSGRASTLRPGRLSGVLRWVPGLGSVLSMSQSADFSELLALMVENGVPLDEGLVLASGATGSPGLRGEASRVADGLRRGESASTLMAGRAGRGPLPAMLVWVLAGAESGGPLAPALRHAAETYRLRARRRSETIQATLPAMLLCLIGAGAAIIYTVSVFGPIVELWHDLAVPVNV